MSDLGLSVPDIVGPIVRGLTWDGNAGAIVVSDSEAPRLNGQSAASPDESAAGPDEASEISIVPPAKMDDTDAWIAALAEGMGNRRAGVREKPLRVRLESGECFGVAGDPDAAAAAVRRYPFGGAAAGSDARQGEGGAGSAEQRDARQAHVGMSAAHMAGRVCVVTGGAQGFGEQIVRSLCSVGANVVIADLKMESARALSRELNTGLGKTATIPVEVDVSDEASVRAMISTVTGTLGGIDLFVSNAGVLIAGSVKSLSYENFRFVGSVNYDGFFLCTKAASPVMALQFRAQRFLARRQFESGQAGGARGQSSGAGSGPAAAGQAGADDGPAITEGPAITDGYMSDIVQINSKSGLVGSNRNGAYAGSKFGAVGLVESFALELIEDGIKVNAICPGNFFDGPLWSDPEKGLFVQYLRAGKVPGAETIADVKRHYEQRVPMGRGCRGVDVARALFYIVDQRYETGQAVPVTGGQVMLH